MMMTTVKLTVLILTIVLCSAPVFSTDYFNSRQSYMEASIQKAKAREAQNQRRGLSSEKNYRYDLRIDVLGMTTNEAVYAIFSQFKQDKRFEKIDVDIKRQRLFVMLKRDQAIRDVELKAYIENAGYGVKRIFRKAKYYDLYREQLKKIKTQSNFTLPKADF